ncbi:MAG TPA: aminotransferase class V-fold PLP-dependent enzyme [candidate division Zixibacteria bacterium]|nr:aminotransferase class V-fold PLP-dependent enzyme [candidate division Zixibacteria bacterium]
MNSNDRTAARHTPIDLSPEEFRALGRDLVDRLAGLFASLRTRPVTPEAAPGRIRERLGADRPLPDQGSDPAALLADAADLLFEHSLFNGHPRFWGYITSSPAPIGALADLLAAAVNPNVGGWKLSPMASETAAQTVRWIAELVGYPADCGGLLTSGGNAANFIGILAARAARAPWAVREEGMRGGRRMIIYASSETHTWLQKAADLFGFGTEAIAWIPVDRFRRMDLARLEARVRTDRAEGHFPLAVVGSAGTVSTGAVDPLRDLAAFGRDQGLWFHVDGAYGGFAAALPEASEDLHSLALADSLAIDPHKWLYAPLEAGCALVRDAEKLRHAFSYHPPYYHFEEEAINYFDYGLQNSRGFRALKVWLALRQVGRAGYVQMIRDDIALARHLFAHLAAYPDLERFTCDLSIATFRYVPADLRAGGGEEAREYLNELNENILERIERGGEAFLSPAMIEGVYALRACVVNFRTTREDIEALPEIVVRVGRAADAARREKTLRR